MKFHTSREAVEAQSRAPERTASEYEVAAVRHLGVSILNMYVSQLDALSDAVAYCKRHHTEILRVVDGLCVMKNGSVKHVVALDLFQSAMSYDLCTARDCAEFLASVTGIAIMGRRDDPFA
jgi:hypothetical protein